MILERLFTTILTGLLTVKSQTSLHHKMFKFFNQAPPEITSSSKKIQMSYQYFVLDKLGSEAIKTKRVYKRR